MSRIVPITVVAFALLAAACQAPESTNTTASVPANGPAAETGKAVPDVGPTAVSVSAVDYVHMASQADMFEIQASQLALQKSTNPKVRDLAQQLIGNQNSDTHILSSAAKAANPNMVMATALDPRPAALLQGLQVEPVGPTFDKKYLASQLRVQREAWALHSGYAQSGDTPILREAAGRIEPRARQQLGAVEQLVATGGL
jgi:putative membrane protein